MTTYRNIHARSIQAVTTDPTESVAEGQIWYNTTSDTFKSVLALEAWSSGANTINSKQRPGGCGTQTAGLACGGLTAPGPSISALATTEEYNGSGWSTSGNLNTARGNTKLIGTQTAAVFSGKGSPSTPYAGTTELYDGTSWTTNPNSANDTYNYRSGCGIQTAALLSGGNYPPTNRAAGNEEFDGTSFSEGGDLPQKQSSQGQAGTQTAAINSFGATNNPVPGNSGDGDNAISLEYDGSSWTAGPNGNGVVPLSGHTMGAGTQTDALFAGGPPTNSCKYDGTTFTVGPALGTAQPANGQSSGPAGAGWIAHGSPVPSVGTDTQEFNKSANVITAAAWASASALNTGRQSSSGFGQSNTLAVSASGETSGTNIANTENYNGTSWSNSGNVSSARRQAGAAGTQTSGLLYGGDTSTASTGYTNATEEYNGSSWTAGGSLGTTRKTNNGIGTQTAAVAAGGQTPAGPNAHVATTEEYNGTSWTSATSMPYTTVIAGACGSESAGKIGGGNTPSNVSTVADYDGTNWTSAPSLVIARAAHTFTGTQSSVMSAGGGPAPTNAFAQTYDGTSFASAPSLGSGRSLADNSGSGANNSGGIVFAGYTPASPVQTTTEEFTAETTSLNIETLTQS